MRLQSKKLVPGGMILVLFLLPFLCGCAGSSDNGKTGTGSAHNQGATAIATITPQLVTPKSVSGSPGKGPLVISSPTTVPGGKPGSQQIILGDRTLIINNVTDQSGVSANSILITLDLAVRNTSNKAIMNQSTFFQLMGSEGDAFGYQYNSSDNFYGAIAAHTTRTGTIVFQVPTAARSSLHLLYRPEIATESAIILLKTA
ncbi:MAG: DUF4352 domain-containing protein [Ktedonobacteraceae bacterium]